MAGTKPTYCWDTCVFLAWITEEARPAGDMEGVPAYVSRIDANDANLVTSVITLTEILDSKIDNEAAEKFRRLMDRSNVHLVDVTSPIAELASKIRDFYYLLDLQDHRGKMTTPDAIHLATALVYKVEEFNTFDDGKKGNRSLLSTNGNVAQRPLAVQKPFPTQLAMRIP